jgi:hypothetical protein
MGRFGIPMLLVAMVIVVGASAGGWMVLSGGSSPEPTVASIDAADSDMPMPPGLLVNMKPSLVTIENDSSGHSFADYGWVISVAIVASLAAIPIVGVYELRGARLLGE